MRSPFKIAEGGKIQWAQMDPYMPGAGIEGWVFLGLNWHKEGVVSRRGSP